MRISVKLRSWVQTIFILVVGILLTSVSIDATDSFQSSQSALRIMARAITTPACAEGMVAVVHADTTLCVDRYEASVGSGCEIAVPMSAVDTARNANTAGCKPVTAPGQLPWRFVTVVQAEQLCARAGKRLLTATEWYVAARGSPDNQTSCVTTGGLQTTGAAPQCVSGAGAFDMVGNVWELVSDAVNDGKIDQDTLPPSGYVTAIMPSGLPKMTETTPNVLYNNDYFWNELSSGTFAVMRGGYYGSGEDGGMYSAHADTEQNFSSTAVGFRCASELPH